jgi:hypothetical protein
MTTQFNELLAELGKIDGDADTLAKAIADAPVVEDDEDEDGGEGGAPGAGEEGGDDAAIAAAAAAAGAKKEGETPFGKSMMASDEEGNEHQVLDATEFVKSLVARLDGVDSVLAKGLGAIAGTMKKQGDLIKSLSDQVASMSAQGRGRKSTLVVTEKPDVGSTMAKSAAAADAAAGPADLMAKANAAYDQDLISGVQLNTISVCLRERHQIPTEILASVARAK